MVFLTNCFVYIIFIVTLIDIGYPFIQWSLLTKHVKIRSNNLTHLIYFTEIDVNTLSKKFLNRAKNRRRNFTYLAPT